jgi:VIT1/CCC1 family predicted Fe2+/Mn2+ transporter
MVDTAEAEIHHRHRDVTGGWLRPATFGVMDGLVSNLSLVAGVMAGGAGAHTVVITGLAGLVAGASSMATGEYTSVASQADLVRAEIATERSELRVNPDEELRELTQLFESRGVPPHLAGQVARELTAEPETAWRVHVREELGVDPDDLPSPVTAATASFAAFSVGAFLPITPFLLGFTSLAAACVVAAGGLALAGGIVGRLTARPFWLGGSRQLVLGALSAALTYGVGLVVGHGLA